VADVFIGVLIAVAVMGIVVFFGVRAYKREQAAMRAKMDRLAATRPAQSRAAPDATPESLGPLVWTYASDNARRGRAALGTFVGGFAGLAVLIFLIVVMDQMAASTPGSSSGAPAPLFAAVGIALGMFGSGIALGIRYVRHGDESFAVHEGGLVHRRGDTVTTLAWGDIESVDNRGQNNALARLLGGDVACTVRFGDGRRIIHGYIHDARHLANSVDQAVYHGTVPQSPAPRT
jgi:hypothetical protein